MSLADYITYYVKLIDQLKHRQDVKIQWRIIKIEFNLSKIIKVLFEYNIWRNNGETVPNVIIFYFVVVFVFVYSLL